MVVTRSQRGVPGSPRTPLTPRRRQRRIRKNSAGDGSSDEENVIELDDIKKSLAESLETIDEENEDAVSSSAVLDCDTLSETDNSGRKRHSGKYSRMTSSSSSAGGKTLLKIPDTIAEDVENDPETVIAENNAEEQFDGISTRAESVPAHSKKRSLFYFPPPKTLVPAANVPTTSIDVGMDMPETYIDVKGTMEGKKKIDKLYAKITVNAKDSSVKDSVMAPDFERNQTDPAEKSAKQKWKERKAIREASAGKEWFNLKPPELTNDVKRDLKILQMRSVLDPKRFYKHNDRKAIPKYFQVGKIMDSPTDFYSARIPKKQRKANLTEELLADAEFQRYQKRKYNEIQIQKKAFGAKQRRIKRQKLSKRAGNAV